MKYAPIGGDLQVAIAADETVPDVEPDLANVIDTVASEVAAEQPAELPTRRTEPAKPKRATNTRAQAPEPVTQAVDAVDTEYEQFDMFG